MGKDVCVFQKAKPIGLHQAKKMMAKKTGSGLRTVQCIHNPGRITRKEFDGLKYQLHTRNVIRKQMKNVEKGHVA